MRKVEAFAPAKVNLTLHVTGQRADGYHLLDSLVGFARDLGDRVTVAPADDFSLSVTGPMAQGVPADESNLVLRAARLMGVPVAITLEKHLPVASGIGGGSSDAAAILRAVSELTGQPIPADVLSLGADLPVCMRPELTRMRGIGEILDPLPNPPALSAVLVNPGTAVSTPAVFAALPSRENPPMPSTLPHWPDAAGFAAWLGGCRNDLEAPATMIAPAIADVLAALRAQAGCALARLSGSGATCFGLFSDMRAARNAADAIVRTHPDWWAGASSIS